MVRVDGTNVQILQLLQQDARTSVVELARTVGRSESTVRERLQWLEHNGVLLGYEARVDWARVGLPAAAVLRASCDLKGISKVTEKLAQVPHLTKAVLLTGRKPVLAMLRVRDMDQLRDVVRTHLPEDGLRDIEVELAMQTLVDRRAPSIAAAFPEPWDQP